MNDQIGTVLLSPPFADTKTFKLRPVLVILDTGDEDIIVARITTKITQTFFDMELIEWEKAGLLKQSVVRLHKINTIEKRLIERQFGALTFFDWQNVKNKIQQIWSYN